MNEETRKNVKRLFFARIIILCLVGYAKATIIDSNSIIKDGIEYYIQTDKAVYDLGENVEILYRVTNLTDNPVSIGEVLLFGPCYNVIVTDNSNNEVWCYLLTLPPPGPPGTKMFHLEPYESKEYQTTWDLTNDNGTSDKADGFPVDPGMYNITGELFLTYPYWDKKVPVSVSVEIIPDASARTIYVDADAPGANDGSSWVDAFNYLQDASATAQYGDEIRVAQGIYKPGLPGPPGPPEPPPPLPPGQTPPANPRSATFQLKNGVTIKGGYAGFGEEDPNARNIKLNETILSGDLDENDVEVNDPCDLLTEPTRADNSYHVVTASGTDKTTVLDGFTITSGNANGIYNIHENLGGGMYTDSGGATVLNCKFHSNSAKRSGGGIHNSSSVLMLINCMFQANIAKRGGGMQNQAGDLTFINCTFRDNIATLGAGGMGIEDSNATLTDCAFSGNKAGYMVGGLHSVNSNATLTNCILTGNVSFPTQMGMGGGIGGGLGISDGNVIVTECIFNGNSAGAGGGMFGYGSLTLNNCIFSGNSALSWGGGMDNWSRNVPAKITNCIFSGNSAGYEGGGIRNAEYYCSATLTNCTLIGNSAVYGGGGIYNEYKSGATLTNCILWGNTAARGSQVEMRKKDSTTEIYYSCIEGGEDEIYDPYDGLIWGSGNIDADPCFVDPGYWDPNGTPEDANDDFWIEGDYHLLPNSACIDSGDPNYIAEPNETDLDGKPRILDGNKDGLAVVDMGAYEYMPPISVEAKIIPRSINLASKGKWIDCYIWLPEGCNVADIDPNSILLEDEIAPDIFTFDEQEQVAIVRFSREEVQNILMSGEAELTISGQLIDGTVFEGADIIRVINRGGGKSAR